MLTLTHTFTKNSPLGGHELTGNKYSVRKKWAMTGTYALKHKPLMPYAEKTIIFQRKNLN